MSKTTRDSSHRVTPASVPGSPHDGTPPAGPIDYAAMYRAYWSKADRWGSHSFADPEPIVDQILTTCGGGRVLDVGCGMGLLVRTMLRRGVDAHGIDVAPRPVAEANRLAPGRFRVGTITDLPFEDGSFQTVVSTDVLEHVAEDDVPQALAELARVSSRYAFVRLAITPDRDHTWHLTVRERAWWEERFFEAGFARHPLAQRVVAFEALDDEGWQITLVLEKADAPALPGGLDDRLDRDRDVLTEVGREAEAAICRATRALWFVRPGDTVVDVAGGLGWRAMILATGTRAQRVISLDPREEVCAWAQQRFGHDGLPVEYARAALGDLSRFADRSVGVLMALDVLDHLDDPEAFLDEAQRVLVPGGRLVVGDPTAGDPDRWTAAITGRFVTERLFVQSFGRDAVPIDDRGVDDDQSAFEHAPRAMRLIDDEQDPGLMPDWTMRVVASDVVGAPGDGYIEKSYPDHTDKPGFNVANYARDHDNPWLLRSMISMGTRSPSKPLIEQTARRVLDSARRGSPDEGSAICVLGYRVLESDCPDPDEAHALIERIAAYHETADDSPHGWRWRISNQFVAARLHLAMGDLDAAQRAFLDCADFDVLRFSPLLASKTIDALFHAGLLAANAGQHDRAREHWSRALTELKRVLSGDWLNIWGSPDDPLPFGLPDIGIMIDLASRCSFGLLWLDEWAGRPGLAWTWTHQRSLSDHRRWIARLEESRNWLDRERGRIRTLAISRERTIIQLKAWAGKLQESQQWLTGQRDELRERLEQRDKRLGELKDWIRAHTEARDWLGVQLDELRQTVATRDATIDDLRGHIAKLAEAKAWLHENQERIAGQLEEVRQTLASRNATIDDLQGHIAKLIEAKAWMRENHERVVHQLDEMRQTVATRDATIDDLRGHIDKLVEARAWMHENHERVGHQLEEMRQTAATRDATIDDMRGHIAKLAEAKAWMAGRIAATQQQLVDQRAGAGRLLAWAQAHQSAAAQLGLVRRDLVEQITRRDERLAELRERLGQRDERLSELRSWTQTQADARRWLGEQLDGLRRALADRDATIDGLRGHIARLGEGRVWLEGRLDAAQQQLKAQAQGSAKTARWAANLAEGQRWLQGQRENQRERLEAERRVWHALGLADETGRPLAWTRTAGADLTGLRAWAEQLLMARNVLQDRLENAVDQSRRKSETITDLRQQIERLKAQRPDGTIARGSTAQSTPTDRPSETVGGDSKEPGDRPDDQS